MGFRVPRLQRGPPGGEEVVRQPQSPGCCAERIRVCWDGHDRPLKHVGLGRNYASVGSAVRFHGEPADGRCPKEPHIPGVLHPFCEWVSRKEFKGGDDSARGILADLHGAAHRDLAVVVVVEDDGVAAVVGEVHAPQVQVPHRVTAALIGGHHDPVAPLRYSAALGNPQHAALRGSVRSGSFQLGDHCVGVAAHVSSYQSSSGRGGSVTRPSPAKSQAQQKSPPRRDGLAETG